MSADDKSLMLDNVFVKNFELPLSIWTVEGSSGEYSDYREWQVCAFDNRKDAEDYCKEAQKRVNELYKEFEHGWDIPDGMNEYDPNMRPDSSGVEYRCYEISFYSRDLHALINLGKTAKSNSNFEKGF